jgi:recombination protein RecA
MESLAKELEVGTPKNIKSLHTPLMLLDFSLGGGIGEGMWIEIFGPEAVGKTTMALNIASFLLETNPDMYLMYIDSEKSVIYERIAGTFFQDDVVIDDETGAILINGEERGVLTSPDTYEEIEVNFSKLIKHCTKNKYHGVLVWDSLVAATLESVIKGDKDTRQIGWRATRIQNLIEKYSSIFFNIPITQLVINQTRQSIVINQFGNDKKIEGEMADGIYTLPGGNAHKFKSFQTMMLIRSKEYKYPKTDSYLNGRIINIIPTKNKLGNPRRMVSIPLIFEIGYSNILSLLEFLKVNNIMVGRGFSSFKIAGTEMDKNVNIKTFVTRIIEDEKLLEQFTNIAFDACVKEFSAYSKISRYCKDTMKKGIFLDARKLNRHLESLKEVNYDASEED